MQAMSETNAQDAENLTGDAALARPYARAVFELAKSQGNYQQWSDSLALMAAVVNNTTMRSMLDNPRLTRSGAADLVIRACGEDIGESEKNLLTMLAENDRLSQLPMIAALYGEFRDEAEGTVEAEVISAQPLSEEQKAAITSALKQRLGRDVQLNCSVNEDLVGGAVVRAGDLVIDGSAVEHLRQLSSALVH
jgi:F-type H+-transporting ATPase subunit delta